ncbi:cysteine hydrolase family protein [Campylobacter ureolyticus]|uniref:nicotinamidase n=1 Tax=Campylobacter ureolyticus TaxID=827 RepID=A0A9Q4KL00_9BACT|nr:isochorismatase family protein [Campylobacter ureolyticus]MCZ6159576.1 isochorismatase family protein [Campylobacter ureolyticus]MCZ6163519.1 isochorismatase family protein [Campylobacter ureolyticus]MCZ6165399.1 isochorismatase family protein [Campylobacter ureolyticus]MCZ6166872.1 isochorismatase family protein [Campylobacter ureolyticus]MCZ6185915.1 isochorismatase family protein [Campylobacter ureolyticus]
MKRLLVVVDFQNDFVCGSLGFEKAKELEKVILEKINEYKNDDIIFTLDTHEDDYLNTIEGEHLPIKHCIKGTSGHEIYGKIKEISKNYPCIEKETFASKELLHFIKNKPFTYESIEICGLVSDICVISNAIIAKAASPKSKILVDSKATSSVNLQMQEMAFKVMQNLHIEVI